jgi:L-malate glycosyltransferase
MPAFRGSSNRVLWLIKGLGLGGAERMLVDALRCHDRGRWQFEVAYLLPRKDFLVPRLEALGARVRCLGTNSRLGAPLAVPAIRTLLRERGIGIIHAHLPLAGVLARLAARGTGVPVAYTEHNLQERYHPLMRLANRLTFGMNARALAVSRDVARSLRSHGLDRKAPVEVLPNGIPVAAIREEGRGGGAVRRELGIPIDAVVVGAVAVFRVQKRLADWLAVARLVCAESDRVRFLLAGDGPERGKVRAEVARLGLEEQVLLPGFRPDGRAVIGALDLFLLTSRHEGLPIALLEAMALGKPTVATSVGGVPEAVTDGREGFLYPVGDVAGLAAGVVRLVHDEGLRARMGALAAETAAARFDLAGNITRIEEIYADLAAGGAGDEPGA